MATKNKPTDQPANTGLVLLTEDAIRAGMYGGAGLKRKQATLLGLKNIQKGWMDRLIGVRITEAAYERFLELGQTSTATNKREKNETWHIRDGALTFGKYKGFSVDRVLNDDPSYLAWACEEMEGFASNLTDKMLRKCRCSASRGGFGGKCQKGGSKPSTASGESGKQAYRPRVQPPPEEERHFTRIEMHLDPTFDINKANDDDLAPW